MPGLASLETKSWAGRDDVRETHVKGLIELLGSDIPPPEASEGDGVVTCGGGKYWPGVVVAVRMLREVSDLPVQVWHRGKEEPIDESDLDGVPGVTFHDATALPHRRLRGWETKTQALVHCGLRRALFLDADAYCVSDPAPLLELASEHRFVSWSDMAGQDKNMAWDAFGLSHRRCSLTPTIQGGQLALDLVLARRELVIAHWLNQHSDYSYHFGFGDQDMWRVAFAATGGKRLDLGEPPWDEVAFVCALDGVPVAVHRCQAKAFQHETVKRNDRLPKESTFFRHFDDWLAKNSPNYSEVEKGLWVGGYVQSPPPGVTAVLNLCEAADPFSVEQYSQEFTSDDHDAPAPGLDWLTARCDWVDARRAEGRSVYVHCWGGVSRSALVVVAHLMRRYGRGLGQTLASVRVSRPQADPRAGFVNLLREWDRRNESAQAVFGRIYQGGLWGPPGDSGLGSSDAQATPYLEIIDRLIVENDWRSVVDLCCGDGRITKQIVADFITAVDVHAPHVARLASERPDIDWRCLDIDRDRDRLPSGGVAFLKDVLHHFGEALVRDWLNWARTCGKWVAVVITNDHDQYLPDCRLGGWRGLDPKKPPLSEIAGLRVVESYLGKTVMILECADERE